MRRSNMSVPALAALIAGCLLSAGSAGALTVKYEFTSVSPNVVLSGGTSAFCGFGTYLNGSATISFTDPFVGGNPVTFSAGMGCGSSASPVTVNAVGAGNLPMPGTGCCTNAQNVETLAVTSAYNNGSPSKTIVLTNGGDLYTLTGLPNTTDPMFRILNTLIPGVSTPMPGGFTNSLLPTLSWPAIPGATGYELQVHTDPFFNTPLKDYFPATNSQTVTIPNLTNGVSYYTRVKATNGPFTGVWSYIGDFTVAQTAPSTPTTIVPSNGVSVPVQTPVFNWSTVTLGTE